MLEMKALIVRQYKVLKKDQRRAIQGGLSGSSYELALAVLRNQMNYINTLSDFDDIQLEDNPPLQGDYQTHSITTGEQ